MTNISSNRREYYIIMVFESEHPFHRACAQPWRASGTHHMPNRRFPNFISFPLCSVELLKKV